MEEYDYDLIVIGSGPAGQKAAIQAAKLGRRALVVERRTMVGGVSVHTGTIPSKTLREAVFYLTGLSQRTLYGQSYRVKDEITIADLMSRTQAVIGREMDIVRHQLSRNRVAFLEGSARFEDPHTVLVRSDAGGERRVTGDKILIGVGTRPARPDSVDFDERTIIDSDGIFGLSEIPRAMTVVGAGVIGIEYASMFAALGTRVTVVERRQHLLEHVDMQIVEALQYYLRDLNVVFRFGEQVTGVERHPNGTITHLGSGKVIAADTVLYSAGRQGATDGLELERAGLTADARGRIEVDDHFRTSVPHIYAAGDVIGFPALAAASMEQGRLAAAHAFNHNGHGRPRADQPDAEAGATGADDGHASETPLGPTLPIGIYTIPEISYVGRTEQELTDAAVPYEIGVAKYRELARGQIVGDVSGILKLLVSPDDRRLLGVHVFGTNATELVHIGQMVMGLGGTVDFLVDTVFNYPTLAESYKVAALDAVNRLASITAMVG